MMKQSLHQSAPARVYVGMPSFFDFVSRQEVKLKEDCDIFPSRR
jgi:hypothetical protein